MNKNILAEVAISDHEPLYSPYGYVIEENGLIHTLTKRYTHGVILALLYPKEAKEAGYDEVDEDYNVFTYQRFELDNHKRFPIVRVAMGMMFAFNVSKGIAAATAEQLSALTKILKMQYLNLNSKVETDLCEMPARKMLELMAKADEPDPGPPEGWKPKRPLKGLSRNYDD